MKKTTLLLLITTLTISLCGCGKEELADTVSKKTTTPSDCTTVSQSNVETEEYFENNFATEAEAVEYYFSQIQNEQDVVSANTLQTQSNGQSGIYVYSMQIIPEGYTIGQINNIGDIDYYNDTYRNTEQKTTDIIRQNTISFTCDYYNNGADSLQSIIDTFIRNDIPLIELSNKNGFYYAYYETHSLFYWCEDNYRFSLCIPSSVGTVNTTTHEYSGEDVFTLQKTFYPFDDNTVAE